MLDLHRWYVRATPPPTTDAAAAWDHYPLMAGHKVVVDLFGKGDWRQNYRRLLFRGHQAPADAAECYLAGLRWNLAYYLGGHTTIDVNRWHYPYPYGPLAADLGAAAGRARSGEAYAASDAERVPFTPHECLLMILPPASAGLLPTWGQALMADPLRGCQHLFPSTFGFDTYLRQYLHEAVPRLPPFDPACILRHTRSPK